jgi:phage terminase large subunit-like protein
MLRWCVGNAVIVQDRQMRVMFDKRNSAEKIDPVVATVMAYKRAMVAARKATGPLFIR